MRTDRRLHRRSDADGEDRNRLDVAGPAFFHRCGRASVAVLAVLLACAASGCGNGSKHSDESTFVSKTFVGLADSYVRASDPNTNYGNNAEIFVDGSPPVRAYLRFQPIGVSKKIGHATLRLYSLSTSGDGFQVRSVAGGWSEASLTYANAPAVGPLVSLSGPLDKNHWVSIDATATVRKHPASVDFALVALGPTALTLASRIDERHAPRLVVEYGR